MGDGIYEIPIFHAAQQLRAIDFSACRFVGRFPEEYLSKEQFFLIEHISVNFNRELSYEEKVSKNPNYDSTNDVSNSIIIPDICARMSYCLKQVVLRG